MKENDGGDLDGPLIESLKRLSSVEPPPESVRERTIEALRGRGAIRGQAPRSTAARRALLAAASIAIFAAGALAGSRLMPSGGTASADPLYMLLVRENPGWVRPAEGDELAAYREYAAWAGALASEGRLASGEELAEGGVLLAASRDGRVEESSLSADGGPGKLGGFFLLSVETMEEAVGIAKDCPHVKRGGVLEVRKVQRR